MTIHAFLQMLIPLLVAIDPVGLVPVVVSVTSGQSPAERKRTLRRSVLIAFGIAVGFALAGNALLAWLGMQLADVMIAGGALLFLLAGQDLLRGGGTVWETTGNADFVPLAIPLMVGPALLTTMLLLVRQHGTAPTLLATFTAFIVTAVVVHAGPRLLGWLGDAGARGLSKLVGLLLAALGVMYIRMGVMLIVEAARTGP